MMDFLRTRSPHILLALTLAACELPTKVGDLKGDESTGTTDAPADTAQDTTGVTTGEPDGTTGTSEGDTTQQTTGPAPVDCAALTEAQCGGEPGCAPKFGTAFQFDGCETGPVYLGCTTDASCDQALTIICRDGTTEAYQITDRCLPAGFSECASDLLPCSGGCGGPDEAACAANGCDAITGHPHVPAGDMTCVDTMIFVFLACTSLDGVCPPFIPTVCAPDKPDEPFDIPSGCTPPGWSECPGAGTPECT